MVTSAADLGDLQTKPNQKIHIYPYMIYFFVSLNILFFSFEGFPKGCDLSIDNKS